MSNQHRHILCDISTECTVDGAISKLLGEVSGDPIREDPNPQADPYEVEELDVTIFDKIEYARDSAINELDDARDDEDQIKIDACMRRVMRYDDLTRQAHRYLCDITDELVKGDGSKLRVDPTTPKNPHITLASLDQWAQEKYSIFIFKKNVNKPISGSSITQSKKGEEHEEKSSLKDDFGPIRERNFLVTFAFFIEEFSETAPLYRVNDEPNAIRIAEHFEKAITAANHNNQVSGQSVQTIRKLITEAMRRKKKVLMKS